MGVQAKEETSDRKKNKEELSERAREKDGERRAAGVERAAREKARDIEKDKERDR